MEGFAENRRFRRTPLAVLVALAVALLGGLVHGGHALAAYPGANGLIAYESAVTGNFEIFVMAADGSGQTNLTNDPAGPGEPEDRDPSWSPDGDRIAFARDSEGHVNIWVMNADGSDRANLTPGPVTTGEANNGIEPTWSPDGTRIAYNSGGNVWVMNADGSGKTNLTGSHGPPGGAFGNAPAWSPDGTRISYGRQADIWVMNADGGGPTRLTISPRGEFHPDWSPDGRKIAYDRDGQVWVMDAAGGGQTRLTVGLNAVGALPAWSPDGTKIAFDSNGFDAPNGHDIFVMSSDGTGVTRLDTPVPLGDLDPSWQSVSVEPPADTVPPTLVLPADLTVEATGPGGAPVTYAVSATDDIDPAPTVTCSPASGSVFPVGTTHVTCLATDAAGNQASGSFAVEVVATTPPADTTAPTLSLPGDIRVEATGPGGARVVYAVSATDDRDPSPTVGCTPASGSVFPLGGTKVTCTATDATGNRATGSFVVAVVDTTPPVLELEKMTVRLFQVWEFFGTVVGTLAAYPDGATDLVDPKPVVVCAPPRGARLAVGTTTVRCTATDRSGNTSSAQIDLVVLGPKEALLALLDQVRGLGLAAQLERKLLTPLQLARIAFEKGAMAHGENALEAFALEVEKQSKKGLSAEAAAKLGASLQPILAGVFPTTFNAVGQKLQRIAGVLRANPQTAFAALLSALDSASARLAGGDRAGALKALRQAKQALADVRDKLTAKDAADLDRDLEAAIASLKDPKGGPEG